MGGLGMGMGITSGNPAAYSHVVDVVGWDDGMEGESCCVEMGKVGD